MCKNLPSLVCCVLILGLAGGALGADPNLMGLWRCDEGTGTTAADSSGHGNDGTFNGNPQWVVGNFGGALEFDGADDSLDCGNDPSLDLTKWTIMFWLNLNENKNYNGFIIKGADAAENYEVLGFADGSFHMPITLDSGRTWPNSPTGLLVVGEWAHYAYSYDTTQGRRLYKNGGLVFEDAQSGIPQVSTILLTIGNEGGLSRFTNGVMDDIAIFDYAMTAEEIQVTMQGFTPAELAANPVPENEGMDVPRDADLTWVSGEFAATHNAYFGDSFDDVNDATVPTASDLTVNSFDPGRLEFGKTYFWRIDEVNGTPDKTVFKGEVWSFTAEPYSIQIPGATIGVTASSSSNEFSGPEKTLDSSGLASDGSHAMGPETMWFTAAVDLDPWIQYEFDTVRKLDIMKVWNSNSSAEMAIGWGVKDVQIEVSVDGEDWDVLQDAAQFSRAPGSPTYNQPDEIAFGGVAARYVRLNIASNWGGILMSYGISEAQFYMIPAEARTPEPVSDSVEVLPNAVVQWRAGREASQHTVFVSSDADAVADGSAPSVTSSANSLDLATLDLELGTTYYWRVDEVNEAEAVSVWAGPVWSFDTVAALTVDDFDSYNNVSPNRPFQTWLDGFGYSADEFFAVAYGGNGTGSGTGHDIWSLSSPQYDGDIMEGAIVVGGSGQSLPIYYNNASGTSHVDRTFAPAQDWTTNGVQTLGLSFFGDEANSGQLYLEINGTKVTYGLDPEALKQAEWHFWAIDLGALGVNLQAVTSLSIGIEGSGSGLVYVDNIALYSNAIEYIEPIEPGTENLMAQYSFEGDYGDSSGHGNTLTQVGSVSIVNDTERGNVAVFNGLDAALQVPVIGDGTTTEITLTTWFRLDVEHTGALWSIFHNDGWSAGDLHAHISQSAQFSVGVNGSGSDLRSAGSATVGQWYHLAYVAGPEAVSLYVNGTLSQTSAGNPGAVLSLGEGTLGAWSNGAMERFIGGSMDDVRIYNTSLSAEEIAGVAGRARMYKPF